MKFLRFFSEAKQRARLRRQRDSLFLRDPHNELINHEFDQPEDIEALAASVGATGARRPASE